MTSRRLAAGCGQGHAQDLSAGRGPRWATKSFVEPQRRGRLVPLASGFPEDEDALQNDADARAFGATAA
jgi:hypothetical protein